MLLPHGSALIHDCENSTSTFLGEVFEFEKGGKKVLNEASQNT